MISFSNFCTNFLIEFKESPSMMAMKENAIDTVKHEKYSYKPSGSLSDPKGEIVPLMTPKQFYEIEEKQGRLKKGFKQTITENYWDDLSLMKYGPDNDYKTWTENITLRTRIVKNLKEYSPIAIENKLKDFNELVKTSFNQYARAYNQQSEKAFREKNVEAKSKNFKDDLFKILEDKKLLDNDIKKAYTSGLKKEMLNDKFIQSLKKAITTEASLLKSVYAEPAVNKPLLHPSAMMDNLFVENDDILISYLLGKKVPFDNIVKNIYKKDGARLTKKEITALFDEVNRKINALVDKGEKKEDAIEKVMNMFAKEPESKEGELKYFMYDGASKSTQKYKQMSVDELKRRWKSFNKTTSALDRMFAKTTSHEMYQYDPEKSLSQNQKMMKSMGALGKQKEIYDFTLPAYKGLVYMERPWKDIYGKQQSPGLAIVNTCPSAALCKTFCYAVKGFYTMYSAPSISAAQVLTFLINYPDQFKKKTFDYLNKLKSKSKKQVIIRWHDAGDFFSRSYFNMIMDIAKGTPDILHYAYTKRVEMIHEVVTGSDFKGGKVSGLSNIPDNFIFNLSYGGKYDKKIQKIPQLADFKFSKVIDLSIPVFENFQGIAKKQIFNENMVSKAHKLGEENHNSIIVKNESETIKSMSLNGKVHKNVKVNRKVLTFNYIPKLAVLPASTIESFKEKNSELLNNFKGIENEPVFHKMFDKAKGHKHDRVVFEENDLKSMLTSKQLKELEDHYPNLYKTYLPKEVQELYKTAIKKYYGLDKDILTYDEMIQTSETSSKNKYHVLVSTNDGDVSAQRKDIHGTLLVIH